MPEEETPEPQPYAPGGAGVAEDVDETDEAAAAPQPPAAPESVEMLLHRVTFPATKTEIVQRVGGKEVALGAGRVTMDRLLADVPGDAYATRETVARLVAREIEKREAQTKRGALGE